MADGTSGAVACVVHEAVRCLAAYRAGKRAEINLGGWLPVGHRGSTSFS